MLYESGAKEVHVRIACPEIKYPDFYGVDMPTKDELLAHKKNNQEMCEHIKAKSLKFLSLNGLYNALIGEKETLAIHNLAIIILQVIIRLSHLTVCKG